MPFLYILIWAYLALEVFLIVIFVQTYGFGIFFLEVVISGIWGFLILLSAQVNILESLSRVFAHQVNAFGAISGNIARVLGGVLLIMPGVLSDVFGVLLLLVSFLALHTSLFSRSIFASKRANTTENARENSDIIIDAEIIDTETANTNSPKIPKQEQQ
ncbi:hypothetical protein BKH46_05140 [Helicobacter sp. 12S02634-8]|uniref:FxsA family protein n=1 Tax=Helicobacter sp. 12S02634-8 TaxID=1476199 RepID=UPI000BA61257|nr:FxsA family protein [Helicobacter sp. 12S02634-8]PAF47099.1 hypothetical protein BKH46_05140 [Helicobacter sp. 12S02634-8]